MLFEFLTKGSLFLSPYFIVFVPNSFNLKSIDRSSGIVISSYYYDMLSHLFFFEEIDNSRFYF